MDEVPDEIKDKILSYLTDRELIRSGEISREFYALAQDELQWRDRTYRKYKNPEKICDSWRLTYRDYDKSIPASMTLVIAYDNNLPFLSKVLGLYYPHDVDKISAEIYDYISRVYGNPPSANLTDTYILENPATTILDIGPEPEDVESFERYMREFISNAVRNYDIIEGEGWYISISRKRVNNGA
jgi:hypothetical protein